jgi:hypothetical protein
MSLSQPTYLTGPNILDLGFEDKKMLNKSQHD